MEQILDIEDRWLTKLDPKKLIQEAPALAYLEAGHVSTLDDVANFLTWGGAEVKTYTKEGREIAESRDWMPPKEYWELVKKEFYLLLCTKDRKYSTLRKKLSAYGNKSDKVIIGVVAAAIGKEIGAVEAGLIAGLCTVCLYGAVKLGKEALCTYISSGRRA